MKGLVISSGEIKDLELLKIEVEKSDYIICADGGFDYMMKIDQVPNLVVGDLDSITKEGLEYINKYNIDLKRYPVMKNETDNELATDEMIKKGIKDITFMGVVGSRYDHSLINIFLLRKLYKKNIVAKIVSDRNIIMYTNDTMLLENNNKYISVIPISTEGAIITLEGFVYPLNKYFMEFGSSRGISNEIKDSLAKITIHNGEVLVLESID